jgi:peptidoglycan/LPS O-acetylase OafA/YrhL
MKELLARQRLPALDGLRAVAVSIVIVYHAGYAFVPGDLGVSIFFVLSGFLITWLLIKEENKTGTNSLKSFYLRRTLRIFPAYYAFLVFSFGLDRIRGFSWPHDRLIAAFTYTMNYYNALHNHPTSAVAHAWSVAIEEQFYLLWPMLFVLSRRRNRAWLLGAIIFTVMAWRSLAYLRFGLGSAYAYNAFDTRFDNIAVGCLLAVLAFQDGFQRLVANRGRWLPVAALVLVVASRALTPGAYHYSIGYTFDAILIAAAIILLIQRPWRWLDYSAVRYVGAISYPMYLYHIWGLGFAHRLSHNLYAVLILGFAATIGMSAASYHLLEKPILSLREGIAKARPVLT